MIMKSIGFPLQYWVVSCSVFLAEELSRATRRTWLILPVVICLFQGLSHANVRVLVLRHRGVCVRLIKRFMVYPTKEGLVPFQRDNCANRAANTLEENSASVQLRFWETGALGARKLFGPKQRSTFFHC